MELGENVSIEVIADVGHDSSCYFCQSKKEPEPKENEFGDAHDENADLDGSLRFGVFHNDAGALGKAIGGNQGTKTLPTLPGQKQSSELEASAAAHHLIPGNASLKKSNLYESEKYLWKDGVVEGNIGYNVNAEPNGEWLPGNYWARPWGPAGKAFKTAFGPDPESYAFAAIDAWGAQFHDAHGVYSLFVKGALDKIFDKLEQNKELWCPEAKKQDDDPKKRPPLYVLVSRLNTVSGRMRAMLRAPTTNWKKNVYTSTFSLSYMTKKSVHLLKSLR
jgi:A nuclease family of the HNH/ENDO VII superfamily with conserved AHH